MERGTNWVLLGLGFNGFKQLNTKNGELDLPHSGPGRSTDTEFAVHTPRPLLTISTQAKPEVQISSTWDSIHVRCTSLGPSGEQLTQTVTTGRWRNVLEKSIMIRMLNSDVRDKVTGIIELNNNLILTVPPNMLIITQDLKSDKTVISKQEQLPRTTSFSVLQDGKLYTLLETGDLHECKCNLTSKVESSDQLDKFSLSLGPQVLTTGISISKVTCGSDHVLLLSQTGSMFSFGLNSRGQLGHGDIVTRPHPTLIATLDGVAVKDIACGHWHCLALSEFGDVYSWGWNKHGQLGHSEHLPTVAIPTLVEIPSNRIAESTEAKVTAKAATIQDSEDVIIVSVSCGARHSVCLSDSGEMYGWGWNGYGQLGGEERNEHVVRLPRCISQCIRAVYVYCTYWNTLFLCAS